MVAMWHVLTGETQLLRMVFTNLLEVMSLSLPYQEKAKGQGRVTRVEANVPKAVSVNVMCVCNCCVMLLVKALSMCMACLSLYCEACFLTKIIAVHIVMHIHVL